MTVKFFKKLGFALDIFLMTVFIWSAINTSLIIYGMDQAKGQLQIVLNAQPVEEVMADESIPDSIKAKLRLIGEVKKFAIDSLGLKTTDNYSTFYDQRNKPLLWVLTASEAFALKAYEWKFPLLGSVSYKGFFDYRKGKSEEQALRLRNYDTDFGEVSAWSTLGWFRDPVLSGMLKREAGALAELIIHEMTHGTIYLESSVDFNENFASMVGEEGAFQFLNARYGSNSEEVIKYLSRKSDYDTYSRYMITSAARLDSLYGTMKNSATKWEKEKMKVRMMQSIVSGIDTLQLNEPGRFGNVFSHQLPNNTWFLSFRRYDLQKDSLRNEMNRKFNGDVKAYIAFVREQNK